MSIKVLLADDHALLRRALRALLEGDADLECVGEAQGGHDAVRLARAGAPDVLVMDLSMPDLDGIEATRAVAGAAPSVRVVALSAHLDRALLDRVFAAGAVGYVLKDDAYDELLPAIRAAAAGGRYVSPRVARELGEPNA